MLSRLKLIWPFSFLLFSCDVIWFHSYVAVARLARLNWKNDDDYKIYMARPAQVTYFPFTLSPLLPFLRVTSLAIKLDMQNVEFC